MLYNLKKPIGALMALGIFVSSYGQDSQEIDYYNLFDKAVGIENTDLYQGEIYTEQYRTINENTQYFRSRDFLKGSLCYEGKCYYDLDLKYDVFSDEVLLKLITKAGGGTLKLFKDKLDSFTIDGVDYIKLDRSNADGLNLYGYYSIAYVSPRYTLYTKYTKKSFDRKDRSSLYYEFLDGPSEHVLLYQGKYHIVNTKKDNIMVFPELKKEIDKFYNLARRLRKTDSNGFQVGLLKRLDILLTQPINTSK
ncbi:hypothetical protein M3P19_04220 [Muricauda sp. 2012CJ35-5]|uniref:Uncharacterized protein n=1 Tax=Flagellimonas spongiicola TaxID=2942208 RepID=A0ABT0PP90_9FLAO|nr:hypothetical protein [Allomuricauda spongiicola]MCL6273199.1 hypothetical protein [Allomuricauda spongiicola]